MNIKTYLLTVLAVMLTSGCSGTYKAYYQTLKTAFAKQIDSKMTLAEVQQSKVDIISVKRGERSTAIMALAYLENSQHKWVSSDEAMLIMRNGRIKRSLGLSDNRLYLSNIENDPLKLLADGSQNNEMSRRWFRVADRTGDEFGYPLNSVFSQAQKETINTLTLHIEANYYIETVNYNAPTKYVRLTDSWENHFWFTKNGVLIKSIQKISPLSESLEITYLSRIARLNQ